MNEEWRAVVGWEGIYEVSSLGNVRRVKPAPNASLNRNLEGTPNPSGYGTVWLCDNARRQIRPRHQLVIEAFIGARPRGMQVNHKDGNKLNNFVENLEYITQAQNMTHAALLGLRPRGEQVHKAKLTVADVLAIRELAAQGLGYRRIVQRYPVVTRCSIRSIVLRRSWRHI